MLISKYTLDGKEISLLKKCSEKKVLLKCDLCGKETQTTYQNYRISQQHIGNTGQTKCRACASSISGKLNIIKAQAAAPAANKLRTREKHPSWKGGKYISNDGYIMINIKIGHNDTSGWSSYQKEHKVIIEQQLGRKLLKNEVIHHIDGIKTNNTISNLWLTDQKSHRKAHVSLRNLGFLLVQKHLIEFDSKNGHYILSKQLENIALESGKTPRETQEFLDKLTKLGYSTCLEKE